MSYTILYTKTAFNDIKKLDIVVKKRLKTKIEYFSKDPIAHAKKLIESSIGSYRWRIGDYRVIFDLDDETVVILRVRHRKESYK